LHGRSVYRLCGCKLVLECEAGLFAVCKPGEFLLGRFWRRAGFLLFLLLRFQQGCSLRAASMHGAMTLSGSAAV